MRRIHAFEFNERPETPDLFRDAIVEILGNSLRWGQVYDPVVPLFRQFCHRTRSKNFLDLCSGTGEPAAILMEGLQRKGFSPPQFCISDLFPNVYAMEKVAARHPGQLTVIREPIDATNVPREYDHCARTIISAFHHFPPDIALSILTDSVRKGQAIFILEAFPRDLVRFLPLLPSFTAIFLTQALFSPRDRFLKMLFSLFIPIIPILGVWDGIVSVLRVHTHNELLKMVASLGNSFQWEFHEIPFFPGGRAIAFLGVPQS
ncbi:hypothetical protein ACFL27_23455 [candidate division CSSED10-310 bacterium]|uniref:Class I SAM-dependent methyltransferase n=1 Tax=candidate division CSSED10-310 bacterium TaxID=2855610 RepID=A0ABV6Z3Z1_UNCC1